jgi:hypothetical protein
LRMRCQVAPFAEDGESEDISADQGMRHVLP